MALEYGPVVVENWFDEPRIGYYDDDATDDDGDHCGVVFFGDMFLTLHIGHYLIPHDFIRAVTTDDLWRRRDVIGRSIGPILLGKSEEEIPSFEERYNKLLELALNIPR